MEEAGDLLVMTQVVAVCVNVPELDAGGWRDAGVRAKYPGSGWLPYLEIEAARLGRRLLSGSEALRAVGLGEVRPGNVQVIQEEENANGRTLVAMGATPSLIFCMESPIYTPFFYDRQDTYRGRFRHALFFSGGTEHVYFPSFDLSDIAEPMPWEQRRATPLVCVMSNHHYAMLGTTFAASPSFRRALDTQLHDARYSSVEYFSMRGMIDLYGNRWPAPTQPIPPGEKLSVIRSYRFALCFENVRHPGYVTEKVIDCLVAGVIPIYLGAPDVAEFVPEDAVELLDPAEPWGALAALIKGYTPERAERMIAAGQAFLRSPEGRRYSYQGFTERVARLIGEA